MRAVSRLSLSVLLLLVLRTASAADLIPVAEVMFKQVPAAYATDGVVQAMRQSQIAAQISGRVVMVAVKAGDRVAAGQILLRIDDRELGQGVAAQQAQVAAAQAQLVNAEASLARTRELVARKFMSPATLDQAEAQARSARAQVDALKAGVSAASASKRKCRARRHGNAGNPAVDPVCAGRLTDCCAGAAGTPGLRAGSGQSPV